MSKAKKIITIIFTVLAVAMPTLSGIFKFIGGEEILKTASAMGFADQLYLLGAMEIGFAALFAFPKTMKIGFILLSCYFAGALATELTHHAPLNAITLITLVWIAAFLRDSSTFLPSAEAKV